MATKVKMLSKYSDLQEKLMKELPINGARVKFIVLLIVSLLKVQSVNYERLAQGFDNEVELSSNLRRIQRFFANFILEKDIIAKLLYKLMPVKGKFGLTMDRTNWKFGRTNINILMIGVIYKGMSLPILWTLLGNKRGNSSQEERIALLNRYIRLFGTENIDFITADREFVGGIWWKFLIDHKIRFYIRMRENMIVSLPNKGEEVKAGWLFRKMELNTAYFHPKIVKVNGNLVYLSGMKYRNQKGNIEYLIVATFNYTTYSLDCYKQRWQIETMFKAFKTTGFNLEDTHLTIYDRIDKLLMLVALAFVWAYKVGIYQHNNVKQLKIKKHGRLEKSFFAYGLESLAQAFLNAWSNSIQKLAHSFLSCT